MQWISWDRSDFRVSECAKIGDQIEKKKFMK